MRNRTHTTASAPVEQAVRRAVDFELSIADLARRSERRAWRVALAASVLALLLAGGYYVLLPLKERIPFLVLADAYTGTATVARLTGPLGTHAITRNEAINRSNVAQYVMARESYDAALLGLRDWNLVFSMSAPPVAASHRARYAGSNPRSPLAVHGKDRAIRVRILSLAPLGLGADGSFGGASVRIQRTLLDKRTGDQQVLDNQLVTLRFTYRGDLALDEHDRVLNPLGFQVTDYRVDADHAGTVPADAPDPSVAGDALVTPAHEPGAPVALPPQR